MFTFNNKGVHFNTKYLSAFVVNKPVYNVNLVQTQGGTINASPLTGYEDTEVTLSNTPDTDYEFDSYSLTGATLYDSNKFILNNDVTAQATWTYVPPPTPPLSANTIRVKFKSGYTPTMGNTRTLVDADENIWDIYNQSNDWSYLFVRNFNLLDVISANTTNVVNMYFMFSGCTALSSVQLFDTSNVTSMYHTFNRCRNLSSVPLFDTSNVVDMGGAFYNCTNLTSVPLYDTSNVTNMNSTFSECYNITDIPAFDTSNVTNMSYTFNKCYKLTDIPFFDTSNVTSMSNMFDGCSSLSGTIPLFNTNKAKVTTEMFFQCRNIQSGALALYQQMSTQTTPPSSHSKTFWFCGRNTVEGYAELQQIPSAWGGFGPNS